MSLPTVTLTGSFTHADGSPASGQITFTPSAQIVDTHDVVIVAQVPVIRTLDGAGAFTVTLLATDAPGLTPSGWTYTITVQTGAAQTAIFAIFLPSTPNPTDLAEIAPATPLPPMIQFVPVGGGTVTGRLILAGSPPLVIPSGAAAGYVLTSDASGNAAWAPSLSGGAQIAGDLGGTTSSPTVVGTHLASPLPIAQGGTAAATAAAARTSLGLGTSATDNVGTTTGTVAAGDDARFHQINGVTVTGTPASGQVPAATGPTAAAWTTLTASSVGADASGAAASAQSAAQSFATNAVATETSRAAAAEALAAQKAANLSDLASASAGRSNLGLGTAATAAIDTTAGDIQPLGTQAAGSSGKVADAAHVHAMPTLDQVGPAAANVSLGGHKTTNVAAGTASTDGVNVGQLPTALPPSGAASGDLGNIYPSPTVTSTHLSAPLPVAQGGTGQATAGAAYNALAPTTALGDIAYASGAGANSRLPGSTSASKAFLTQTGTGSVSAAPAWGPIAAADLPTGTTSAQGALQLDGTSGDMQPSPGAATAGASGLAADAKHIHPQPAVLAPTGLTGATAASRYVGATGSGAPASGTFALGDFVLDQTGKWWTCTTAGTPGTWVQGGTVTSVTAADSSIVVSGTAAAPTVQTGTLDAIAAAHPPAAAWSNNSKKITSLANGTAPSDGAAFGQIPTTLPPSGTASGDLGNTYPSPTVVATHLAAPLPIAQGGTAASSQVWTGLRTPTAVKTSAYTAAPGDFVPCDTTAGSFTVTLPSAPANLATISIKLIATSGTNTLTLACGGTDVFNKAGGSTTGTLTLVNQAITLQYAGSSGIWYVYGDDLPLSQLDGRYLQAANNLSDVTAATARTNLGLAYGSTPTISAVGDTAATGSAATAARGDHTHGREAFGAVTAQTAYSAASGNGTAVTPSRSDHTHGTPALSSSAATASAIGDTAATGTGTTPARSDHVHGREAAGTPGSSAVGDTAAAGSATTVARSDHTHGRESFGAVTAQTSYGASSANGTATTPSRSDHTHGTPSLTSSAATTSAVADAASAGTATTAAKADHTHGRESFGTPGSSAVGDAAAAGSATSVARSDHTHGREAFAAPGTSAVADTASAGTATTLARSDHRHGRESFGSVVALTAFNTASANGSATTLSRSDHVHGILDYPNYDLPSDNGLAAWTFPPHLANSGGNAPTAGILFLTQIKLVAASSTTLAKVYAYITNAGTTPTNCYLGLYDSTGTLQASTADQSSNWTSTGVKTISFSATYSAAAGKYWLGVLIGAGAVIPSLAQAPAGGSLVNLNNLNLAAANYRCASTGSSLTALPSSFTPSALASQSRPYWLAVST